MKYRFDLYCTYRPLLLECYTYATFATSRLPETVLALSSDWPIRQRDPEFAVVALLFDLFRDAHAGFLFLEEDREACTSKSATHPSHDKGSKRWYILVVRCISMFTLPLALNSGLFHISPLPTHA